MKPHLINAKLTSEIQRLMNQPSMYITSRVTLKPKVNPDNTLTGVVDISHIGAFEGRVQLDDGFVEQDGVSESTKKKIQARDNVINVVGEVECLEDIHFTVHPLDDNGVRYRLVVDDVVGSESRADHAKVNNALVGHEHNHYRDLEHVTGYKNIHTQAIKNTMINIRKNLNESEFEIEPFENFTVTDETLDVLNRNVKKLVECADDVHDVANFMRDKMVYQLVDDKSADIEEETYSIKRFNDEVVGVLEENSSIMKQFQQQFEQANQLKVQGNTRLFRQKLGSWVHMLTSIIDTLQMSIYRLEDIEDNIGRQSGDDMIIKVHSDVVKTHEDIDILADLVSNFIRDAEHV